MKRLNSTRIRVAPRTLLALLLSALLLASSCAGSEKTTGGETHFLKWCSSDPKDCGSAYACVCGVCTRTCSAASECGIESAQCVAGAENPECSSSVASYCEVRCSGDAECRSLSPSHFCDQGVCRTAQSSGGEGGAAGAGAGGNAGAAGAAACPSNPVAGNQVLVLGDTFMASTHQVTAELESLARAAGALPAGQRYRDESTSTNNALAFISNGIANQYAQAIADAPVQVVIMNGGGADVLAGPCEAPYESCSVIVEAAAAARQLFATMASDGVAHVVYAFYPNPTQTNLREKLAALRPLIQTACSESPLPCHWLELETEFAGHPEYLASDGMNPSSAGAQVSALAIWQLMQRACIAQ
ncbi:MAG: hypothetical protein ACOY0T_30490 [Myxococcota bacterium]